MLIANSVSFLYRHLIFEHSNFKSSTMRLTHLLMDVKYFDIIIAGGGMVGSAMACSLASAPLMKNKKVLLLDSGNGALPSSDDTTMFSNRVSAINPGSRNFFERIGIWDHLCAITTPKVVRQLRVWDSCSSSRINFEHEDFAREVAYIIENNKIVESCVNTLKRTDFNSNVQVKYQSKVTKVDLSRNLHDLANVELDDGSRLSTSLLIGADGGNSKVRSAMNAHYVAWSYDQKAIVATLDINTTGDNSVAWQRFTPTGPVALLPLTESKSSLVWTTTPEESERLMSLPCDQFVDELNKILWDDKNQNKLVNDALSLFDTYARSIVPGMTKIEQLPPTVLDVDPKSRAAFPLGFGHSTNYIAPRAVLIGDAAHRIHPLAGQGVNLGFGDCEILSQIINQALCEGADIGSTLHLKDYESKRQLKNLPVMLMMDFLNRLYRNDFSILVAARSLGLNITNYSGFLKKFIMEQASVH